MDNGFLLKTICLLMLFAGLVCGAQEVPQVTLHHTGDTGKLYRDWPVPPGTRYTVKKITVNEAEEKLAKDEIRVAVTTVPLRRKGLKTVKFAYQAMIFAVHPSNPLRDITLEQARLIFDKNQGSWRTFGGPLARLHLYIKARPGLPPPSMRHDHTHRRSMPRTILQPEPLGGAEPEKETKPSKINYNQPLRFQTASDARSFSLLSTDVLGMACFDITRFDETRVRILSVNRIPPTLENFRYGGYPLLTTYYLTVPENPTEGEQKLIGYLWSRKFAARLYRTGLLPEQQNKADKKPRRQ